MAVVTDIQPKALKVLKEFGDWTVTSSNKMTKYKHEVHMFVMSVRDFADNFNRHNERLKLGLPTIDVEADK